jgi:hypothetical protein
VPGKIASSSEYWPAILTGGLKDQVLSNFLSFSDNQAKKSENQSRDDE